MDRAEGTGIGISLIGHVVLFGALSVGFLATPNPQKLESQPIEVSLGDEVALESQSPTPNADVPAAKLSEIEAPVEPDTAPPVPDAPEDPMPSKPEPPKPAPAPDAKPAEKPRPDKPSTASAKPQQPAQKPKRPSGGLPDYAKEFGRGDRKTKSDSVTPPGASVGPQVKAALGAEIRRQLKPHWKAPPGADADKLVTTVRVRLKSDGTLAAKPVVIDQDGVTPANRAQAELHKERAVRAVELAAPFNLPAKYYGEWKDFTTDFDKGLSQ